MRNFLKREWVTILVLVGIASGLFIAYQTLVVVPREEIEQRYVQATRERIEALAAEQRRQKAYEDCDQMAWEAYSLDWDAACKIEGEQKDCTLPGYRADQLGEVLAKAKDRCVAMYR